MRLLRAILLPALLAAGLAQGPGEPAPDFRLLDVAGERVALSDYEGKPLMLNFWATWCPPCQEELPLFQRASDESPELAVLLVNAGEDRATARRYLEANGLTLRSVVNPGPGAPADLEDTLALARRYRVRGMPTTFFIRADGAIDSVYVGEISPAVLAERLAGIGVAWRP